ncbi:UNKNOWN [Stylonychia lemnae]|uniref:Uncharacterized protein n=1 Tax=Stylonychia lemnae TaxID=5949 RepID=A0A078BCH9_STYLE|nr:UNKNOWN [Stylonychia lemnae]|eukprot:CDW90912.1 UNKNOWN [Stylonychia lemnae]
MEQVQELSQANRQTWSPNNSNLQELINLQNLLWRTHHFGNLVINIYLLHILVDLLSNTDPIYINRTNFDIGLQFFKNGEQEFEENIYQYFSISYQIVEQYEEKLKRMPVQIDKCGQDRFGSNQGAKYDVINQYICLEKSFNYKMYGSEFSKQSQAIVALVSKCKQEDLDSMFPGKNLKCKNETEISKETLTTNVQLIYMFQSFDENDYSQPIKNQLSSFMFGLKDKKRIMSVKSIKRNFAQTKDSFFSSHLDYKERQFFTTKSEYDFESAAYNDVLLAIRFFISNQSETVQRQAFSILDAITATGGFMSVIFVIAQILVGGIQKNLFFQSLIKKSYLVYNNEDQNKNSISNSFQEQEFQHQIKQDSNFNSRDKVIDQDEVGKIQNSQISEWFEDQKFNQNESNLKVTLDESLYNATGNSSILVAQIVEFILRLNQFQFNYYRSKFLNFFKAFKSNPSLISKQHRINIYHFEIGQKRLEQQLDIRKILQQLKNFELLQGVMTSKYQQQLFPFLPQNILNIEKQIKVEPDIFGFKIPFQNLTMQKSKIRIQDNDLERIKQLKQCVKQLEIQQHKNKVDQRLFKNLLQSREICLNNNTNAFEMSPNKMNKKAQIKSISVKAVKALYQNNLFKEVDKQQNL